MGLATILKLCSIEAELSVLTCDSLENLFLVYHLLVLTGDPQPQGVYLPFCGTESSILVLNHPILASNQVSKPFQPW